MSHYSKIIYELTQYYSYFCFWATYLGILLWQTAQELLYDLLVSLDLAVHKADLCGELLGLGLGGGNALVDNPVNDLSSYPDNIVIRLFVFHYTNNVIIWY